jgi:hypothetical protein
VNGSAPLAHRALLAELRRALRSEIGARAMYGLFARRRDDAELAAVLVVFHDEERDQIERVCDLIRVLGARARARCLRRELFACALYAATFVGARAIALRACYESECSLARGYWAQAEYLDAFGLRDPARAARALSETKSRHARVLEAWIRR